MIDGEKIWNILSKAGKKVGVVNVPMTYPIEEVNGFIIGGFPLPNNCLDYTYPLKLALDLHSRGWILSDIATQAYSEKIFDSFLDGLYVRLENRTLATLFLMERNEWDFLLVHFLETDKVLHEFWKYMEKKRKEKIDRLTEKYGDVILNFFRKVDESVYRLIDKLDEDTLTIIMSDHGFCSSRNFVHLNNWLIREGFMHLKKGLFTSLKRLLFRIGFTLNNFYRLLPESTQADIKEQIDKKYHSEQKQGLLQSLTVFFKSILQKLVLTFDDIDWSKTKACCLGNSGLGHIFINVKGGYDEGSVELGIEYENAREEILERLREFRDPRTGQLVVDNVYKREDIYSGKHLDRAADIIVTFRDFDYTAVSSPIFVSNGVIEKNYFCRGESSHNMEGIIVLYGKGVKRGSFLNNACIMDVAPTILYSLGVPIPPDLDGRVLEECFMEEFRESHLIRYGETSTPEKKRKKERYLTDEAEEKIRRMLRAMGYLG